MKKIIIQTIVLLIPIISFGQEFVKQTEIARNTIYIEALGQGLYNSFSFDRLYNVDKKIKTSLSAGLTIIPLSELFVFGVPVSYNYLFGQKNHHLELGIGLTAMYLRHGRINVSQAYIDDNGLPQIHRFVGHSNEFYSFFTPKIGYRFQKPNGGFFLRLTFTPPIAGINIIGDTKGDSYSPEWTYTNVEYFESAAFFGSRAFPWAGISIGWTLKK